MNSPTPQTESEFYPSYSEFSKTLRTWFVAYGIGGPVILLANETAWPMIVSSKLSFDIGVLFLAGGGVQVLSALLNKHAMWHLFYAEEGRNDTDEDKRKKASYKNGWRYKLAEWYSEQNWIDELLDVYTLVLFGWATALAFRVLRNPTGEFYIRNDSKSQCAWLIGIILAILIGGIWYYISQKEEHHNKKLKDG